ncbi:DUF1190 domain-containing protein [Psychrosphaera sp. B3R10]|uniref:DUF1190 domain-containing protein n=1 Tax=Psychrosphaera algicola TaxID=3023714 RepID=A0ABT5FCH4_9GAMM|nr:MULTISPECIES: DUF1190 domain-containing protein [unclassified Psychrosphaera]MBU2881126.1 DUF1190 domain-containing protein [Psychrosphaera sp. I2R16]MBU2990050.1 DUF1190 domain-containing protein [Psychrosphaera sp. B3R10]MDC2889106.1 DUF1190 domain-containing protein [Psychrosphaera sp. G1-22]MDO6721167.1 DUF1190 domain-containing protein [Psychrosphaera sp. 1_MG-2023]
MKRTKIIDLSAMRKIKPSYLVKPITLAVAAAMLSACGGGNSQEVTFVKSVDDCVSNTDFTLAQCEVAYEKALEEAEKTGPKYKSMASCESEFGPQQCLTDRSGSFFMPFMAGFIVNQLLFDRSRNYYGGSYNPVYRYNRPYSRYHDTLMLSDGTSIGKYGKNKFKVSKSATSPKPKITKTVSRGGFGSVASAKSSWGGGKSSSSKGWGG